MKSSPKKQLLISPPRQPNDYSQRLPAGNFSHAQQQWMGQTMFSDRETKKLRDPMQLWYKPPDLPVCVGTKPDPEIFLLRRVFLWVPRLTFKFDFKCPICVCIVIKCEQC